MAFSKEDFCYDPDQHFAPPIRIRWKTRSKILSKERWVFVQCCGQTRKVDSTEEGRIISSIHPCKTLSLVKSTLKHYSGCLILKRSTNCEIRLGVLAQWSCCGAEIPSWNDAWDSRDGKIPFEYVNAGCKDGRYNQDNLEGSLYDSDDDYVNISQSALIARPLKRRAKPSRGKSSGDQTFVLQKEKIIDPRKLKFTQNTVERNFSDGRVLLDTMIQIFQGKTKIEDIPQIRVAARDNTDDEEKFYSADNRRLLMFKILRLDEICVTRIKWMDEFDVKLQQNVRFDPETRVKVDEDSISSFREELAVKIFRENDAESDKENEETGPLYIPSSCAGYVIGTSGRTIRRIRGKFLVKLKLQNMHELPSKHPLPELIDVVAVTINKRKDEQRSNPEAARKQILKMVSKLITRNKVSKNFIDILYLILHWSRVAYYECDMQFI